MIELHFLVANRLMANLANLSIAPDDLKHDIARNVASGPSPVFGFSETLCQEKHGANVAKNVAHQLRRIKLQDPLPSCREQILKAPSCLQNLHFGLKVSFSPDGHRIVSGGLDETARVWDGTPLLAEILQAQEARYQQKQTEVKGFRDRSEAEQHAKGGNRPSPEGQWDVTATALGKTIEGNPNNLRPRHLQLLSLMQAGNRAGIQRAREDLLKRFGNATDPMQANLVAWYCVLAPDAVSDHDVPVRLAVTALAGLPERGSARSDALITLGAALYRAGRFEEAVGRLNESIQTNLSPRAFAFLALAHHRLGHRDEAKRWLDKLVACQPKEGFETSPEDFESRLLRREVESLVAGGASTTSPAIPSAPTKKATVDPGFAIVQGAESGPPGSEVPQ